MEGEDQEQRVPQEPQALQEAMAALQHQLAIQNDAITRILTILPNTTRSENVVEGQETKNSQKDRIHRKKAVLPKLQEFDGKRSEWAQWFQQARMKLEIDAESIGDSRNQFAYIFSSLRGSAAQATLAYVKTAPEEDKTGQKLLQYMDNFYGDPVQQQRATVSLSTIKQKEKEPFFSFLPRFETTLANAGGMTWPDAVKIAFLHKAINQELRNQRIGQSQSTSYQQFVSDLLNTSMQITTAKMLSSSEDKLRFRDKEKSFKDLNAMDWEPTRVNKLKISSKAYEYRKANNLCLRCGKAGHRMKDCWLDTEVERVTQLGSKRAKGTTEENEEVEEEDYSEKE